MTTTNPNGSNHSVRTVVFAALSVAIAYHLIVIGLLPNGSSVETRALAPYLTPYANQMAFNTPWQFFSPGPSPTFYLEYEVESGGDLEDVSFEAMVWPPPRTSRGYDDQYNRSLYSMRYFALNGDLLERFFVPWLCRRHPTAHAITVQPVFEQAPELARASWLDEHDDGEGGVMRQRVDLQPRRFECGSPEE